MLRLRKASCMITYCQKARKNFVIYILIIIIIVVSSNLLQYLFVYQVDWGSKLLLKLKPVYTHVRKLTFFNDQFVITSIDTEFVIAIHDYFPAKGLCGLSINLSPCYDSMWLVKTPLCPLFKSCFFQVLEKNAKNLSLDQYAASMAVNGFRGYMNEYMKHILPKHTTKESKTKRKRTKDESTV